MFRGRREAPALYFVSLLRQRCNIAILARSVVSEGAAIGTAAPPQIAHMKGGWG